MYTIKSHQVLETLITGFGCLGLLKSGHIFYHRQFISPSGTRLMATINSVGPIEQILREKLSSVFSAQHIDIVNESHRHSRGRESHFNVTIVSNQFIGKTPIERHRMVFNTLSIELKEQIHALSIRTKTVNEWSLNQTVNVTPSCMGGGK